MTDTTSAQQIEHISDAEFEQKVLKASKPVMVDFYADWCGPCKLAAPILEDLAKEQQKVQILKMNVDEHPETARNLNIMSIPTVVLWDQGKEVERQIGFTGKQGYVKLIDMIEG